MNMELNTSTDFSTPESRQFLDKHLRCFLDSITRTKTVRIDTAEFLERICYIKLTRIAPNPENGYNHRDIVHPAPATRDDLMTHEWSRYLPDLPKPKSPFGWVTCLPHKEDAGLRQKSDARNKIWYNLLYKRDYTMTENESFWFNVTKKHKSTKSLHDVLLTRSSADGNESASSCSYPSSSSES